MGNYLLIDRHAVLNALGDRTQAWLAKESGLAEMTVSHLLNRNRRAARVSVVKIANALGVDPSDITAKE